MNKIQSFDIIKKMSKDLDLDFEQQDWGIMNANPDRYQYFLDYYNDLNNLVYVQKYYLGELIIASFNERLICDQYDLSKEELNQFRNFISKINLPLLTDYWRDLEESDEFKVSKYI